MTVRLDGVMGYGSSFLEEVFGGLRRSERVKSAERLQGVDLVQAIQLESRDQSLVDEIVEYLSATRH